MRADALALGAIMLVGGIGLAIWANAQADEMGMSRIVYPEEYDSYQAMAVVGLLVGALGAGIALYGLASSPQQTIHARKIPKTQTGMNQQRTWQCAPRIGEDAPAPSGQTTYCPYCASPLVPGAPYCPGCARPAQK